MYFQLFFLNFELFLTNLLPLTKTLIYTIYFYEKSIFHGTGQWGDNCYRVAALSLANAVFKGREGELLNISVDGPATNGISIHGIHFVTKAAIDVTLDDISHCETTGIDNINASEDYNEVYNLQGRKLSKAQRGMNIIRSAGGRTQGKKVLVNR